MDVDVGRVVNVDFHFLAVQLGEMLHFKSASRCELKNCKCILKSILRCDLMLELLYSEEVQRTAAVGCRRQQKEVRMSLRWELRNQRQDVMKR